MPLKDRILRNAYHRAWEAKNRERLSAKKNPKRNAARRAAALLRPKRIPKDPEVKRLEAVARASKWASDNRERYRENMSKAKFIRRAKEAAAIGPFRPGDIGRRMSAIGGGCLYCSREYQCIDHIMPIKLGDRHALVNFAPACRRCNAIKKARHPEEWLYQLEPKFLLRAMKPVSDAVRGFYAA